MIILKRSSKSGSLLGICFLGTAAILAGSELIATKIHAKRQISAKSALSMGLMQALAIFPGMCPGRARPSRAACFCGVDRTRVAKFSFLMSVPIILGSVLASGKDAMDTGLGDVPIAAIIAGTVAAAVAGFFCGPVYARDYP